MGIEIERKFLLANDDWRDKVERSVDMVQAYLASTDQSAIRVRIENDTAKLNIKHTVNGIERLEYEYGVPVDDAREMAEKVARRPIIDKTRHYLRLGEHLWEIDEFHAENDGLIVAEIELDSVDEAFQRPDWLGEEVSEDLRYFNSSLSERPYSEW